MKYLGVAEVQQLLKVGKSKAYAVIRELNAELGKQGYMTISGKIPEKYLMERFYLDKGDVS